MSYRDTYEKIAALKPRPRGFAFEKLINQIFDDCDVLISDSYRTADSAQQIDGAVEINGNIFLLEAKWENEDTLAASKLYSFLGKVNSKIEGTYGVFISHNELKDNFVNAVRDGLRQNCILIHGVENIEDIIDEKVKLDEFLWYCYRQASTRNRSHVSTSEFLSIPKQTTVAKIKPVVSKPDNWMKIYDGLTGSISNTSFMAQLQNDYVIGESVPEKTINILPSLSYTRIIKEKLTTLFEIITEKEKEDLNKNLIKKFQGENWRKYGKEYVVPFLPKVIPVEIEVAKMIIENITSDYSGDWEIENDGSRIFDLIYKSLDIEAKKLLAASYLDILTNTSREDRFAQKQFAKKLFLDILDNSKIKIYELFQSEILEELQIKKKLEKLFALKKGKLKDDYKTQAINSIVSRYSMILRDEKEKEELKKVLTKEYENL